MTPTAVLEQACTKLIATMSSLETNLRENFRLKMWKGLLGKIRMGLVLGRGRLGGKAETIWIFRRVFTRIYFGRCEWFFAVR